MFIDLYGEHEVPVTDELAATIMALPVHHGLVDDDIDHVLESISEIVRSA